MAEQARIEAQLHELEGMRDIQVGLELTHISEDEQMSVDRAPEPRPIEAKLRALEKFVRVKAFFQHPPPLFRVSHFIVSLFDIYILVMMILNCSFLFREALSVKNMVTRCRDYHLKKLWNLSGRHMPRISRGNDVCWRGGKSRASRR